MKRIALITAALLSAPLLANEAQNRAMLDMMKSMAGQSAENQQVAECLGTTVPKMKKAFNQTIDTCFDKLKNLPSEEFTDEISACLELELPARLGISNDRFDKCDQEDSQADHAFMTPEMKKLQDQIDQISSELDQMYERGASESDIEKKVAQLDVVTEQMSRQMEQAMAPGGAMQQEIAGQLEMLSKSSEGTLHLITLPIYPQAKVMMHMPVASKVKMGKEYTALPAATFTSSDEPGTIADYYQKKLKGYQKKVLATGDILFMQNMPANFDVMTHMETYVTQPHVLIKSAEGNMFPGAVSFIEIAYQPK